jgi:methyltransferase
LGTLLFRGELEHENTRRAGCEAREARSYRYLSHPNYVVVVVEILTFPLIFGAWITALVFTALNAALLSVRIREEDRALTELLHTG